MNFPKLKSAYFNGKKILPISLKPNSTANTLDSYGLIETSHLEVSIHMVIHRDIFKDNQMRPFPCFTFIPETGISFSSEGPTNIVILRTKNHQWDL